MSHGVNIAYIESKSDFPIFDESLASVSFEAMAESSTAYGMNWSGRLSIGHYYPSNDANDESFGYIVVLLHCIIIYMKTLRFFPLFV